MKTRNKQSGFTPIEVILVVAVVAIVGLLGCIYYNNQVKKTASNSNSQISSQPAALSDVKSAPTINSVTDLDTAQVTLDQTDPGGTSSADTSRLDAELANF